AVEKCCNDLGQILEKVDIGGSTLIRAASKNFPHVTVVTDPADYFSVVQEMQASEGCTSITTRARLASKAFNHSADYEAMIATTMSRMLSKEETLRPKLIAGRPLRYGENPDQQAWVYQLEKEDGIAQAKILNGKELSFNNYEDATAAYKAAQELHCLGATHGCAIIKHGGLCGYASADNTLEAFRRAWAGDSKSAFGGVVAFTHTVPDTLIDEIKFKFVEVLIAPGFSPQFLAWAKEHKRSLRLLQLPMTDSAYLEFKRVSGGMLVQTPKKHQNRLSMKPLMKPACPQAKSRIRVVTERLPSPEQEDLLNFAMASVKFAKSNAVSIVREHSPGSFQLVGMGAGQPNRVDSLQRLALPKAIENLRAEHGERSDYDPKIDLSRCVLASDGFFPFPDSIRVAAEAGLATCIQPGGSVRDDEVIEAARDEGMCMIFSGERSFTH
ncbi:MAG: bifunctional phosphoribosylaminoimidazolecarboxamide formyltransferase/IMP cyclohydrolase PurH, partial [Chlamydiia bacterium]|nr:bifunctional phosphoribosylaminoimidazolecarboxamide formyltransferase/IMP cyclohydrolase PurH [Chlamydiia bacterium]